MNTVFFVLAKIAGALVSPGTWVVLGAGLAAFGTWRGITPLARRAAAATFGLVLALSVLPLGDLLLRPLETRHPPDPPLTEVTGIVVLGGGEEAWLSMRRDQVVLGEGAERLTAALALARAFPQARVVYTGGSGALRDLGGTTWSGADVAQRFFAEQGLDPGRLTFEHAARNTAENAVLTLALIAPAPEETWVLVTSAFHMPRAMASFRAAGWDGMLAWPVDYRARDAGRGLGWDLARNLTVLDTALREYLGLLAYWATGR